MNLLPFPSQAHLGGKMDSGLHFSLPCLPEPISQRACQFSTLHYLRVVLNRIRAQRPKVTQAALSSCKVYIIFSNPEIVAKLVLGLSLSCWQATGSEDVERERFLSGRVWRPATALVGYCKLWFENHPSHSSKDPRSIYQGPCDLMGL